MLLIALVLGACAFAFFAPAHAQQIYRCVSSDGTLIFSDRSCDKIGAEDSPTQAANAAPMQAPYRGGCPRSLQSLADTLRRSIAANDPNRLATIYLWSGQSTRSGYDIMSRLTEIARHPLVALSAIYSGEARRSDDNPLAGDDSTPSGAADNAGESASDPPTPVPRAPIAIRLDQTLSDSATPTHVVLGLRRRAGCWWVTL